MSTANRKLTPVQRKELIELVRQSIVAADLHHGIWWVYMNKEDRGKYRDVFERCGAFFDVSRNAQLISTVIVLYGLYEPRPNTANLNRLFDDSPEDLKTSVKSKYDRAQEIWRKIAVIRNNHIGHVNDKLDVDDVFRLANIRYKEFEELIELSKSIVNSFSYAEDKSTSVFNLKSGPEIHRMLDALLAVGPSSGRERG